MIHIIRKKGSFQVMEVSRNHEVVKTSIPLLSRKGAIKNVQASLKEYGGQTVRVQDNTGETPVMILVNGSAHAIVDDKPGKPFTARKKRKP